MNRVLVRLNLPDVEVTVTADDPARWVAAFDGTDLVGFVPIPDAEPTDAPRRAYLFLPANVDAARLRFVVAEHPAELAA